MEKIRITNLRVKTIIGTLPKERKTKQILELNIVFDYDASIAAKTDDLKYAVDYLALVKNIKEEVEKTSFYLVEKLADHVLSIIFREKRGWTDNDV
ncbi:MAG: dihydroneopterin aldolase [Candidatus Omnitrophica bacterium]|nr:dihydroneopterin aldolase [Candidatus Omnitrophota bacterium]